MEIANPLPQRRGRRQLEDNALVPDKDEGDLRMTGGLKMKLMFDVAALGVFRTQELPPRRQIVEKRTRLDLRPGRFPAISDGFDSAARDDDLRAGDRVRFPSR